MVKKNEMNVKMFQVENTTAPFVMVNYMDKDAQEHSGLMLLDSCSNRNILSSEMIGMLSACSRNSTETAEIITLGNVAVKTNVLNFSFVLGNSQFHEDFCINEEVQLPKVGGVVPIVGILGNVFMSKHELVIDYSNFTFHKSSIGNNEISIDNFEYFFPMAAGVKYYNLPAILMKLNGREIVAITDSGATDNIMASQSFNDSQIKPNYVGTVDTIIGYNGVVEANDATVSFEIVSIGENETKESLHNDLFKIIPSYIIPMEKERCDENGTQIPPVEAIIGSPFMAKESWVLDFGAGFIYKKKAA